MRQTIAIDIDDVLFDFTNRYLSFHNEQYGTAFDIGHITSINLYEATGGTPEDDIRKIEQFQTTTDHLDGHPAAESLDVLRRLGKSCDLVVVTARQTAIRERTRRWIERHFPGVFREVRFANYWEVSLPLVSKGEVCVELGVDVIVDDQLNYLKDCADKGVRGILFGDYPWNAGATDNPLIRKARSWHELEWVITEHKPYTN